MTFSESVLDELHSVAIYTGATLATTLNIIAQPVNTANKKCIFLVDLVLN